MFQAAAGVRALIFEIEKDAREIVQRKADQVCVSRALDISVDLINGVADPGGLHGDSLRFSLPPVYGTGRKKRLLKPGYNRLFREKYSPVRRDDR